MNFNLHFGELHSDNSTNDKNNLFENYVPECYKVKQILISFNCFSEYIINAHKQTECTTRYKQRTQTFTRQHEHNYSIAALSHFLG